jgi:hypothetical protein
VNTNLLVGVFIGVMMVAAGLGIGLEFWLLRPPGPWGRYLGVLGASHSTVLLACFFVIVPFFHNSAVGLAWASGTAIAACAFGTPLIDRLLSAKRKTALRGAAAGIAGMTLSWLVIAGTVYASREGF